MHISWHGSYTLKIQTGDTTVVTDPYSPAIGLRPFRSQGTIVALTNPQDPDMSHADAVQGTPTLLTGPGEFAVQGVSLHAIPWQPETGSERVVQRWGIEGVYLLNLASLSRELTDHELQEIERVDIDVVVIPVGGGSALTTKQAVKMIGTLEPRLVIPIHYALPGLKEKLDSVNEFAEAFGIKPSQAEKKVIIKGKHLPQEDLQVVLLAP